MPANPRCRRTAQVIMGFLQDFTRILLHYNFQTPDKGKCPACLLLNCKKMLTLMKLKAYTTLEMQTHTSAINLVPACTHSYEYVIFPILRSSLTLILSVSSLLCGHQLVPFFSPSHTLPLCCESSGLPGWPSPAWIIAISYLLTNFYLTPSLFSCQNCPSDQITFFLSTDFPLPVWSRHCEMLLCVPSSPLGYHDFSYLSCTALLCQQPWTYNTRWHFLHRMLFVYFAL